MANVARLQLEKSSNSLINARGSSIRAIAEPGLPSHARSKALDYEVRLGEALSAAAEAEPGETSGTLLLPQGREYSREAKVRVWGRGWGGGTTGMVIVGP